MDWRYVWKNAKGRICRSTTKSNQDGIYVPPFIWQREDSAVARYIERVGRVENLLTQMVG